MTTEQLPVDAPATTQADQSPPPEEKPEGHGVIHANLLALSIVPGKPQNSLITLALRMPRIILAEFNTHRAASRSTASNRAKPAQVVRMEVFQDPFIPLRFGKNAPGMSDLGEELAPEAKEMALHEWRNAMLFALQQHAKLEQLGVHKQIANRVVEPFQWAHTVVTLSAQALHDMYYLRSGPSAQPEFQVLVHAMVTAAEQPLAEPATYKNLHIPFGSTPEDIADIREALETEMPGLDEDGNEQLLPAITRSGHTRVWAKAQMELSWVQLVVLLRSAGQCARATFSAHGEPLPVDRNLRTALICWKQWHASVFEHQAMHCTPGASMATWTKSNFPSSWLQFRKVLETKELDLARDQLEAFVLPKLKYLRVQRAKAAAEYAASDINNG